MKVTNNSKAVQGIQTVHGVSYLKPEESKELSLTAPQAERASRLKFLTVKGDPAEDDGLSNAATDGKDGVYIPAAEFNAMREAFEKMKAENADLRKQIADAGKGGQQKADEFKAPFEAKDKGAGWWAIYDGDGKEVRSLRKDDAEIFNALSDADKAAEVAKK